MTETEYVSEKQRLESEFNAEAQAAEGMVEEFVAAAVENFRSWAATAVETTVKTDHKQTVELGVDKIREIKAALPGKVDELSQSLAEEIRTSKAWIHRAHTDPASLGKVYGEGGIVLENPDEIERALFASQFPSRNVTPTPAPPDLWNPIYKARNAITQFVKEFGYKSVYSGSGVHGAYLPKIPAEIVSRYLTNRGTRASIKQQIRELEGRKAAETALSIWDEA